MTRKPWVAYAAIWAAATALASLLTWYGVHDVMRNAVFGDPGLVPPVGRRVPSDGRRGAGVRPAPTLTPSPTATPTPTQQAPAKLTKPTHSAATPPGDVKSFTTAGGRAALIVTATEVKLVSATPNPGYTVTITREPFWLRVDFTIGMRGSSIVASWYEHVPTIQTTG